MRLSIRNLLILACVAISLGFAVAIGASSSALSTLRIGGPLYQNLKADFDLLADILPPPEYVIEPYLEATIAKQDTAHLAAHSKQLATLQKAFNDRVQYWHDQSLTDDIRNGLAQSNASAASFWSVLNRDFMPALARGDSVAADRAYAILTKVYLKHRKAVDDLVAAENLRADQHQKGADASNKLYTIVVWVSIAFVMLLIAATAATLMLWLMRPLQRISDTTRELADGKLENDVPGLARHDELGGLARAINVFKQSALDQRNRAAADREKAADDRKKAQQIAAMVAKIASGFQELSKGNLEIRIEENFPQEFESLRRDFNTTVEQLHAGITAERDKAAKTAQAVGALADGFTRLSGGDFKGRLETPFAADFEQLRTDFNKTVSNLDAKIEAEREAAHQTELTISCIASGLKELSGGNLEIRLKDALPGEYEKLRTDFNAALARLQDTMQKVTGTIGGIENSAGEISGASDDLARRTEQQAASLEQTAAALEEITATMKTSAQNAMTATTISANAKSAAEKGGEVVDTAIQAMGQIEQSSKQISDITGVIDEIAFQTNLLALNAGVEAARAGDAGKGFAVVASEVRALAQRSSEAARQIKTLINTTGDHVAKGVTLVENSGKALREIMHQVLQINALIADMTVAAQQQSTGVEEVNTAVSQMDQVTQQNAAMVEQTTAAARGLADETTELARLIGYFNVGQGQMSAKPASRRAA